MALVPGLLAPYDPEAEIFPPSDGPVHRATGWARRTTARTSCPRSSGAPGPSMVIAVGVGLLATLISIVAGVTAAYVGGLTDSAISLVTDVFLVIPTFPLIIVIASYAQELERPRAHLRAGDHRLVVRRPPAAGRRRCRLRRRDFLESARVRGERRSYIIVVEILPTMTSLLVANFLGAALYAVLTAAGLQFIGLGDPQLGQLGHDAVLGQDRRGAADRAVPVGDRPRPVHRGARRRVRPAELRVRRDQQPGAATGAEAACQAHRILEVRDLTRRLRDRARRRARGRPRRPGRAAPASSSASSASPAAASRRCCSPSLSCSARRPGSPAAACSFNGPQPGRADRQGAVARCAGGTTRSSCRAR